ncbi:S8 family serine peptidase [Wenzhouxiangella limi]|uniref:S8 family serine peptidase n=1 Tax=Wenzhouxiangella limi TaxID=2707351 RepID=A0A845V2N4_9GAMM|nr:S8 family serine peptidase [Wenzhouxiangella limi]NDY94265.1 S8 family serine peptidase [Wenzhouxiangella limi]
MGLRHNMLAVALAALLGFLPGSRALADEVWVRIDQPDTMLRAQLPDEAIDYGAFVWMPERVLPDAARGVSRIHRQERPFSMPVAGRTTDPATLPDAGRRVTADPEESGFHLVQFRGPVKHAWLNSLRARGLEPMQFIAPNAYLVWGREDQLPPSHARSGHPVRFAGSLPSSTRVHPLRNTPDPHEHARAMIYGPAAHATLAAMRKAGARVRDWRAVGGRLFVVDMQVEPARYPDLLAIAGVLTVQQVSQDAGPRGEMANQSVVTLRTPGQTLEPGYRDWLNAIGLDGDGVVVAVVDAGVRQTHQDLAGRFVDCAPGTTTPSSCSQANDDHGTHVAGAIAGTGASNTLDDAGFLRGLGMAPGARLVQQRYPPLLAAGPAGMLPGGMLTIFAESALSGAVLANNSWGPSGTPQGYDIPSREVDLVTRNALPDARHPAPILPVWSIMNGGGDNPDSVCAPASLGAPDEAKNVLAVGSSKMQFGDGSQRPGLFDISANSAHGPACDGRRVPQLIAPGCATDNPIATADDAYSSNFCGTSMASPVVTGAAALFVEQYRASHGGATPSPALIKARLTASARDLQGFRDADGLVLEHRPDRKQGWGRLDAEAVLRPDQEVFMLDQTRIFNATGQAWTGRFTPVDPTAPMQVMLAWSDAPGHGLGGTMPAWVNDLDLIVHQEGVSLYGNGFGTDGFSITGTSPDPANNLEGVVLAADQHQGEPVRIEVLAANLAADAIDPWNPGVPAQDFALACVNCERAPDFTLSLSPQALRGCVDEGPLTAQATVRSVLGFEEPVSLTAQALDGFGGTLDLQAVTELPAFSTTLSVETKAVEAGDYRVLIEGSSVEAGSISSILDLGLDAPLSTGPDAVSPSSEEPVSIAAGFAWTALDGAEQYRFELASSPDFSNPLEQRVLEVPAWQPQRWLEPGSTYYWRVRGENACGAGTVSETFSIETETGPASALGFVTQPDPDGQGGFVAPIEVEILDADGERMTGDNQSLVELSLDQAPDGTGLTGTLVSRANAGVATFEDLGISAEVDGDFALRASLNANESLALEGFSLGTLQTEVREAAAGLTSASSVVGLAFSGTVTGITDSPSFASDLRLVISAPDGRGASLGGFETASDQPWEFEGEDSSSDGAYRSEHPTLFSDPGAPVADEGFWQFEFRNDFASGELMSWDEVVITLIKQPIETVSDSAPIQGSRIFQDRFETD